MKLVSQRGQSTGEYAILFAIVLGAVLAMQNFVRNRIAGGLEAQTNAYVATVGAGTGQLSSGGTSDSTSTMTMTSALAGTAKVDGTGASTINFPE